MENKMYQTPRVLKTVTVRLENSILGSVVTSQSKVKTMGQEVVSKDFSDTQHFVQDWDSSSE